MKLNVNHKTQMLAESYLFAALALEGRYFGPKLMDLMDGKVVHINWAVAGYSALAGVIAPALRTLVARYPALSPFAKKLVTVVDTKAGIATPPVA